MRTTARLFLATAACATLPLGLAACSGSDDSADTTATAVETVEPTETATDSATESSPAETEASAASGTSAAAEDPEQVHSLDLNVGDCLTDETSEGSIEEVGVIDCAQPHTGEIYHGFDIAEGPDGQMPDTIDTDAETGCVEAFAGFVGVPWEQSALSISWMQPSPDTWEADDREVLCVVFEDGVDTTGSLEGSNR